MKEVSEQNQGESRWKVPAPTEKNDNRKKYTVSYHQQERQILRQKARMTLGRRYYHRKRKKVSSSNDRGSQEWLPHRQEARSWEECLMSLRDNETSSGTRDTTTSQSDSHL